MLQPACVMVLAAALLGAPGVAQRSPKPDALATVRLHPAAAPRQTAGGGILTFTLSPTGRATRPPRRYLRPTPADAREPLLPLAVAVSDAKGRTVRPAKLPATKLAPPRPSDFARSSVTLRWNWRDWYALSPGRYAFTFRYDFAANYPGLRGLWARSERAIVRVSVAAEAQPTTRPRMLPGARARRAQALR